MYTKLADVILLVVAALAPIHARQPAAGPDETPGRHLVIPSLANATRPADLDFQAGECDVDDKGTAMTCQFQQVFLTVALFDAKTCLVTTNRYERTFVRGSAGDWVSRDGPEGECGIVDEAILHHEGTGARWTLEMRKTATRRAAPACRVDEPPETLSWQNVRRTIPCTFVQPGAMSR
jgi:hypothetical protein